MYESRREYLTHHRSARAWAALDRATNDQMKVAYDPYVIEQDSLNGKHVVVIGSGVGGLTTAYEVLATQQRRQGNDSRSPRPHRRTLPNAAHR